MIYKIVKFRYLLHHGSSNKFLIRESEVLIELSIIC